MGLGVQITSTFFRVMELICGTVVTGLIGEYLHFLGNANVDAGPRIIYAIVTGGLSLIVGLVLLFPFRFTFYAFPADIIVFILWMAAFGLLLDLTGRNVCESTWFWSNWGYYWGGYWETIPLGQITPDTVGSTACGKWETVLAFSFLGGVFWFCSAILGGYVCMKAYDGRRRDYTERSSGRMMTQRRGV